ncbi:chitinase [Holotrichia oblita]|uniref:Chitinase n=1 Tax=Holotrichia oblita TaxID=644536 RepID=A0ACB9TKW4_HOLOL|nr:chitinase [Holotrichia oblita]
MYRPEKGKFQLENVNPTLCTHLILAFVLLDERDISVKLIGNWKDLASDDQGQSNITKLKEKYPHLKVLVSIGGWQDGSIKYSKMAANPESRSSFVNNTLEFIRENNLDGLDLFWEYPTKRGGSLHDKTNLVHLVKELRVAYDKHNLLLTAGLGASKDTIDNGYDVPQLSLYLDYMFMMCYDYSGWWSRIIGPNAPLHGPSLLNVEYTITYMLKLGADPEKLILGIPFYGRPFLRLEATAAASNASYFGQKFKNSSFNGPYTQEDGFIAYNEICLELSEQNSNWFIFWDDLSKTPYVVNGEKFISYDNHRSISEKIKFALNHELGGVMAWSIDTDDFRGDCNEVVNGQKNYPLLRAIDQEIHEFLEYQREHPNSIKMGSRVSHVEISVASIANLSSFIFFVVFASYFCWNKP